MAISSRIYLGVFDGHNASAAVFADGSVQSVVQEERFTRVKNFFGPPDKAVEIALQLAGVTASQVDRVCFASQYLSEPRDPGYMKRNFDDRYDNSLLRKAQQKIVSLESYRKRRLRERMQQRRQLVAQWGIDPRQAVFHDHHTTHAATAYYGLKRDSDPYLVVTLDGGGDGLSGSVWTARDDVLKPIAHIDQADSLGELYAVTTHLLGFVPLEHEYKLMGMAPYASPDYAEPIARIYANYLSLDSKNSLQFNRTIPEPTSMVGPRLQRDLERMRFDNICAGLQLFTERLLANWVAACVEATGINRVLAAGGVFMNVKANQVVSELNNVSFFEAFPSSGDESLSIGACYLSAVDGGESPRPIRHCYLGNDLSAAECEGAVRKFGSDLEVEKPLNMPRRAAELLAVGEIIARASGPMEFGARALGNRSIIADPSNQDVVRIINHMIKKRDFWMPFAPVVLRSHAQKYFSNPKGLNSAYMMNTFDSTERRAEFMAAVHNADLTARPQLLEEEQNPEYEAILHHFGELTDRHVLLNTSFNLHGYPVVCSAVDAMEVFLKSGLKWLILGSLLVSKKLPGNETR